MPLETLLARYEEGTRLAAVCQAKLAEAELKVKQLEQRADGQFNVVWKTPGPVKAKPWSPFIEGNDKKPDEPAKK